MSETRPPHEIVTSPHIEVSIMNRDEAYAYCQTTRLKHAMQKWSTYPPSAPKALRPFINGQISEDEFRPVFDQWYSTWSADEEKNRLTACVDGNTFKKGLAAYLPLQKAWGFNIPPRIDIKITPCEIGAGGSYDVGAPGLSVPTVFMYHNRAWPQTEEERKKMRTTREEVLLHEIFHLGIEDIVLEWRIDQPNKERVVDTLVKKLLHPHILSSYLTQGYDFDLDKPKPRPIDPYLHITDMTHFNLPRALKNFREQNPALALLSEDDPGYLRFLARKIATQ